LPETDLALIATMPFEKQRPKLESMRLGKPPFSYAPVRALSHDIFNVQHPMFNQAAPTRWEVIAGLIEAESRTDKEAAANVPVAKALYDFAIDKGVRGFGTDFFPLAMSTGHQVTYWSPILLIIDEKPLVPFIDPRVTRSLTAEARRFVFSMMHQRIRAADPDYAHVEFGVFQFTKDRNRHPILHTEDGVDLFSFDELESMVSVTYALWQDVCENRQDDPQRRGTGTDGLLL